MTSSWRRMAKKTKKRKGKTIKFEWVETGAAKAARTKITLKAELEGDELRLISAKCFPGIVCLTCGPSFFHPCTQLTVR